MQLYKLTDASGNTRGGTHWGPSVTHHARGDANQPLCTDGWIHAYEHPLLAVLLNPIHAGYQTPRLWEASGEIGVRDGQIKCGCRSLTTIREMAVPAMTVEQHVRFAIACTWPLGKADWRVWAIHWLDGADRTWTADAAKAEERAWAATVRSSAAEAARAAAEAGIDLAACAEWAVTSQPITDLYREKTDD